MAEILVQHSTLKRKKLYLGDVHPAIVCFGTQFLFFLREDVEYILQRNIQIYTKTKTKKKRGELQEPIVFSVRSKSEETCLFSGVDNSMVEEKYGFNLRDISGDLRKKKSVFKVFSVSKLFSGKILFMNLQYIQRSNLILISLCILYQNEVFTGYAKRDVFFNFYLNLILPISFRKK